MTASVRLSLPFEDELIALPEDGTILIVRGDLAAATVFPVDRVVVQQSYKPEHDRLAAAGFAVSADWPETAAMAVVCVTRTRAENRGNIARALALLPRGGVLVVDGLKTNGVDSLLREIKKLHPVDGQDSKAHGKVFWLTKEDTPEKFDTWLREAEPHQNVDGFTTQVGIFSAGGVDPGSAFLAENLDGKLKGMGADLGAGWGWLSAIALRDHAGIEVLDLVEAEALALGCARKNVTDPRAAFHWADALEFGAKARYDFVIMNPPFHTGRAADASLGQRFILAAARILKPSGTLFMVANRQLAYEKTLDESFQRWEEFAQTGTYKAIKARKPK